MKMRKLLFILLAVCAMSACSQSGKSQPVTESPEQSAKAPQYKDLAMPGMNGQTVKISDYVGVNRLVLVDFWASWCPPCRAEMPNVVRTYADFHDQGFEVVGVSFDSNKEAWVKGVEELMMPWPQMSDLKGWESKGAEVYGIHAIPANVLIDQQGRIIAKNLRGEELYNTVAEQLK